MKEGGHKTRPYIRNQKLLMSSVNQQYKIGLAFARSSFLKLLAYRVRYIVGTANYFLYVSVHFFIMKAVMLGRGGGLGSLQTEADLLTYFAIAWSARAAYFNNVDFLIAEQVSSGNLAMDLIRPASFPWMKYAETAGETVFRFFFMSLPVLGVLAWSYWPKLQAPPSLEAGCLFGLSLLLAFHIYFTINFLTGLVAVVTLKVQGFLWAKFMLVQLLSGVMIPLSMFPEWSSYFLERTPFAALGRTPVLLYQGKLAGTQAYEMLGWQCAWVLILFVITRLAWKLATKKISIQGG